MAILEGATAIPNAISSATAVLTGPASAMSSVASSISGAFSGFSKMFVNTGVKLPLANPLFKYASYTYVLGLGCLTEDELNNLNSSTSVNAWQMIALEYGRKYPASRPTGFLNGIVGNTRTADVDPQMDFVLYFISKYPCLLIKLRREYAK